MILVKVRPCFHVVLSTFLSDLELIKLIKAHKKGGEGEEISVLPSAYNLSFFSLSLDSQAPFPSPLYAHATQAKLKMSSLNIQELMILLEKTIISISNCPPFDLLGLPSWHG